MFFSHDCKTPKKEDVEAANFGDYRGVFVAETLPRNPLPEKFPRLEFFTFEELVCDRTDHPYVPRCRLLSENEVGELLARYGLGGTSDFPAQSAGDFVSRFYGARRGDVFMYVRVLPFLMGVEEKTYRVVV